MSNYPPPQYGTSHNLGGHMAPLAGTYSTESSRYTYQNQTQAAYLHGPGPSNGVSPTPHANASSFYVNAQGVTPPSNGVNQGFAGYGTQSYPTVLPSPPFPPVRSSFGSSQFPQDSNQAFTTSTVPSTHVYRPSEPTDSRLLVKAPSALAEAPKDSILAVSELEDGEVDDEGSDNHSNPSDPTAMGVRFSRAPAQGKSEESGLTGANLLNGNINVTHGASSGQIQDSPSEPDYQHPTPSHHPQTLKPKGDADNSKCSTSSRSMGGTFGANLPPTHAAKVNASVNTELVAQIKEDARQALLDLHSHGHDFDEIVGRGMDPTFLRRLYTEVGIPIYLSPSSQLQRELELNARGASAIDVTVAEDKAQPKGAKLNALTEDKDASNITKTSPVIATQKKKDSLISLATTAAPKKASTQNPSTKTPGFKAADSKPLDRKEYIARMLAAKAGKLVTSISSSIPLKPSAIAALEPLVHTPTTSAAVVPSLSAATPVAQAIDHPTQSDTSIGLPQSHKANQDVDAKRKAQTDLARQKMEALKSQRETAKATSSSEPANQISAFSSANASQPPVVAPMMITQLSAPSRQGSYFSPASQKAPFSIPGLFMTAQPDRVKPLEGGPSQSSTASTPRQQERCLPAAALYQAPLATEAAPIRQPIADTMNEAVPVGTAGPALTYRKRQKAADFLDSPPTRVKRPLGQQEDSSVIIDISDEDMADSSDDDSTNGHLSDARMTASKNPEANDIRGGMHKSIGDLPPLSDFPSQKKAPPMTPPSVPTPSQTKDPKGLKCKEMEIELMNRKIAELEQRISTKKTTSRAITPGGSGNTTASPAPKDSSRDAEAVSKATDVFEAAVGYDHGGRTRQLSLPTADIADTAEAEQKLHEVERAKASVERSLAADLARASNEQRMQQEETLQNMQDQAHSRIQRESQRVHEPGDLQQQQVEQQQVDCELHGRTKDEDISQLIKEGVQSREKTEMQLQEAKQKSLEAKEQLKHLEEHRRKRRHALESGLPVLDVTVEKIRRRLESMRKEVADLEIEVQKGIEGRKALVEELKSLSQAQEAPPAVNEHHRPDILNHAEQQFEKADSQAATVSPSHIEIIEDSEAPESKGSGKAGTPQEPTTCLQQEGDHAAAPPSQAATTADGQLSDGEVEEDVMDISRSEIDEGELSEYSPKLPNAEVLRTEILVDDEEGYEPASDSGVVQQHPTQDPAPRNDGILKVEMPDADLDSLPTSEQEAGVLLSVDELDHNADPQDEEQLSHPSMSLTDDSDPDDYEPPEPALPPKVSALGPESSISSLPSVDVNGDMAPLQSHLQPSLDIMSTTSKTIVPTPHEGTAPAPIHLNRHFTPYESPLKQFKSYRNHPEYLNEVSHGFRSLTYSHAINPELPMCRYELDGVCNDASCQSQHFKSLGLSDERILVDLGTTPRDSDANAYTDGLKLLVQDIRSRKIKDVNKVASEITAYRRNLLGETRVISM